MSVDYVTELMEQAQKFLRLADESTDPLIAAEYKKLAEELQKMAAAELVRRTPAQPEPPSVA
jgi:hypothetical protein